MQYYIGDVARVLGITPNALHFLEKEDIISVKKDESGYRNYTIRHIFRLLSYQKYRSMGYPLKAVRQQFKYELDNRAHILSRVETQMEHARERAAYYTRLSNAIEQHMNEIREIDALLGAYELAQAEETVFLFDSEGGWLSKNKSSQLILRRWVKAMPSVRLAFLELAQDENAPKCSTLGYMAAAKDVRELNLPLALNVRKQEACLCLHTICAVQGEEFLENAKSVFDALKKEARARGLTPCAKPWGNILLVEIRPNEGLRPYLSLWLPVYTPSEK